eukprot:102962_1
MASISSCICCLITSEEDKIYRCAFVDCPHSDKHLCNLCGQAVHRNISDHHFSATKNCIDFTTTHKEPLLSNEKPKNDGKKNPNCMSNDKAKINVWSKVKGYATYISTIASTNSYGASITAGLKIAKIGYDYSENKIIDENDNIDPEEAGRLVLKTAVVTAATLGCSSAAAIIIPITGPAGIPIYVGYGILGSILSSKMFEKYLPNSTEKRKQLKLTALSVFNVFEEDIKNQDIFNKKSIEKKYKKLTKLYHPDTKYGSKQKFQTLEVYHRIVLSLLDDSTVFPMVRIDEHGCEYIDNSNEQPKAIAMGDKTNVKAKKSWFESSCWSNLL